MHDSPSPWLLQDIPSQPVEQMPRATHRPLPPLLAWLAGLEDDHHRVLRLAGAATSLREKIGAAQPPVLSEPLGSALGKARKRLGSGAEKAWRQGTEVDPEHVIAYALREVDWEAPG